jgi:hypothetical protein
MCRHLSLKPSLTLRGFILLIPTIKYKITMRVKPKIYLVSINKEVVQSPQVRLHPFNFALKTHHLRFGVRLSQNGWNQAVIFNGVHGSFKHLIPESPIITHRYAWFDGFRRCCC